MGYQQRVTEEWFLLPARVLLVLVVCGTPWLLGGVEPATQFYIQIAVLAALALTIIGYATHRTRRRINFPTLTVPILSAIWLTAVQLTKLRFPVTAQAYAAPRELLAGHTVLSIYPASTRFELARLSAMAIVFCLGFLLFRTRRSIAGLWIALLVNGSALSAFGIVQLMRWNGKLYWTIPLERGGQTFASFVNRNNACGFLTLTLAAGIGLLLWSTLAKYEPDFRQTADRPKLPHTLRNWLSQFTDLTTGQQLSLSAIILILAGIGCSSSRAGIAATLCAIVFTMALFRKRYHDNLVGPVAVLVLLSAVLLVSWAGLSGQIGARLSTLLDERVLQDGRFSHWQDSIRSVADHPWMGTGLGTYRYAYQPYERTNTGLWHYNADNQYLEWLVEGGLLGLSTVLSAILLFAVSVRQLIRTAETKHQVGLAYAGVFLLVSQSLQACFDFGVNMTSNMLLLALMAGVISGQAATVSAAHGKNRLLALPSIRPRLATATIGAFLFLNCLVNLPEVYLNARSREALSRLPNLQHSVPRKLVEIDRSILAINAVVRDRPDDAELNYWLGELWTYRYRLQALPAISELSQRVQSLQSNSRWSLTRISVLHAHANLLQESNDTEALRALRMNPLVQDHLQIAAGYFRLAQTACPLLPHVDFRLAELAFLHNNQPVTGVNHIRRSIRLSPSRADIQFGSGLLAFNANLPPLGGQCWRESWRLSPKFRPTILRESLGRLSAAEVARLVIPDDASLLIESAQKHFVGSSYENARFILADRALSLVNRNRGYRSAAEKLFLIGQCHAIKNAPQQAVRCIRRAVDLEPHQASWRFTLAQNLAKTSAFDEAIREVGTCVRWQPDNREYLAFQRMLLDKMLREPRPTQPSNSSHKAQVHTPDSGSTPAGPQ